MKGLWKYSCVLVLCSILNACTPPGASDCQQGSANDPLATRGLCGVGHRVLELEDPSRPGTVRTLHVWYPTVSEQQAAASVYLTSPFEVPSARAREGVEVAEGSFPLIIYSHGTNGAAFDASSLLEELASRGFIIAAPHHASGWFLAPIDSMNDEAVARDMVERQRDISFVISEMLAADAREASPFAGRIDAQAITALGHSVGGSTVVSSVSGLSAEDLGARGFPAVGLEQPLGSDPRVRALVTLGGATVANSERQLGAVSTPWLALHGTEDQIVPLDPRLQGLVPSRLAELSLLGATHYGYNEVCRFVAAASALGLPVDELFFGISRYNECKEGVLPAERVQAISAAYITAFVEAFAAGEPQAQGAFTPGTEKSGQDFVLRVR